MTTLELYSKNDGENIGAEEGSAEARDERSEPIWENRPDSSIPYDGPIHRGPQRLIA